MSIFLEKGFRPADLEKGVEIDISHHETSSESSEDESEPFYDDRFEDFKKKMSDIGIKHKDLLLPFDELKKHMTPIDEDNGVLKQVLKMGTGIKIPEKAVVMMHYDAFLENQKDPFDSTRLRNRKHKFLLGEGAVIVGLDLAIKSMKKDEISKILVPPEFAYGKMGCPPRIPGSATILYIVEILSFIDSKDAIEFEDMHPDDQKKAPFDKIVAVFHCEHKMANDLFRNKHYKPAIARYRKMVRLLEDVSVATEEDDHKRNDYLLKLFLNLSAAYANIHYSGKARTYADLALKIDKNHVKALYRMGRAHFLADEFDEAETYLKRAKQKLPFDKEINKALIDLGKVRNQHKQWESEFCKNMFCSESKEDKPVKEFPSVKELKTVLEEEFKKFIESDNKELRLSPGYTVEETEIIEELARAHKLVFVSKIHDGTKLLKVVKH